MHARLKKHKCCGCYKDRSLYTNQMPVSLYTCFRDREERANVIRTMYVCLCYYCLFVFKANVNGT